MKRLVIGMAVFLVLLLAAMLIVPSMIDWNGYRSELERQTSRILDRPVRIGGKVSLQLLPTPYLSIGDIRIAGEDGRFGRPFLKIGALSIRLAVPPLLSGEIEASEITIREPELQLAIDAEGRGNWRGLGATGAMLPIMPKSVALNSVRVENGTVRLIAAVGEQGLAIAAVNGELAAPALVGPYRFKGSFRDGTSEQEIRLSTGALDDPGGAAIKLAMTRAKPAIDTISIDGLLHDLQDKPRLEGTVTGSLRSLFVLTGSTPTALDITAKVDADTTRAALTDIVASLPATLDPSGKPLGRSQEIRGRATAQWGAASEWTADFTTYWVDLERWLPVGESKAKASPLNRLAAAIEPVLAGLPAANRFRFRGSAADAELAGGRLETVRLAVERDGDVLKLTELSAGLPGQTSIEVSGQLGRVMASQGIGETSGQSPASTVALDFAGPVRLSGANMQRLLKWALPEQAGTTRPTQTPFLIEGDFAWSPSAIRADKVRAEIAGNALTGHWHMARGPVPSVDVALDTDILDLSGLWQPPANLSGLLAAWPQLTTGLTGAPLMGIPSKAVAAVASDVPAAEATPAAEAAQQGQPAAPEAKLDLRIGWLRTEIGDLRDVRVAGSRANGKLDIASLEGVSELGYAISAAGQIDTIDTAPTGSIGFTVSATTAAAFDALKSYFELPLPNSSPDAVASLLPLQLAGSYRMMPIAGKPGPGDLVLDGVAGSSRLSVASRGDWIAGKLPDSVSVTANFANPQLMSAQLQRMLGSEAVGSDLKVPDAVPTGVAISPAKLALRLENNGERRFSTLMNLEVGTDVGSVDGRLHAPADAADWTFAGNLSAKGEQPVFWASLLGLPALEWPPGSFRIAGGVNRDSTGLRITEGTAELLGRSYEFALNQPRSASASFDLELKGPEIDLVPLAEMILAKTPSPTAAIVPEIIAGSVWSDKPFDFNRLPAGRVRLNAESATLAPGFLLRKAVIDASLSRDGVTVSALGGEAYGGVLSGSGSLKKADAGAALNFTAKLQGFDLDELSEAPLASANLDVEVTASAQGVEPRGMIELMSGSGKITVSTGELDGFSAFAVDAAARAVLSNAAAVSPENLQRLLARGRLEDSFKLTQAAAPLSIRDGVLSSGPLDFDSEPAALKIETVIDLRTAALDSEWMLSPKPFGGALSALPPVTYTFVGPLAGLAQRPAKIDVASLEKELLARRIAGGATMLDGLRLELPAERAPPAPKPQPVSTARPEKPATAKSGLTSAPPPPAPEELPDTGWGASTD